MAISILTVDLERHPHARAPIEATFQAKLPNVGAVSAGPRGFAIWRTPREWLLCCAPSAQTGLIADIRAAIAGNAGLINDASAAFGLIELSLERARGLLSALTSAPTDRLFADGSASLTTRFAHVRATLARLPDRDAILVLTPYPDASYVAAAMSRADTLS